MNYWASSFLTWQASVDKKYWGAIDIAEVDSVVLEDNFVAGAERVGINFRGDVCHGESLGAGYNHSIKDNTVYSSLGGVVIMMPNPTEVLLAKLDCIKISGFTVFKSVNWGIYYHGTGSVIVDSNTLIDNQVGIFTYIYKPKSTEHEAGNKTALVQNSLVVGQSPSFDCVNDVNPSDINFESANSMRAFGAGVNFVSKIGLVWSNFLDGTNGAPGKPWSGILTYNQIAGLQIVKNLTFAHFDINCNGTNDAIISSCLTDDDGQHPVTFENIKLNFVNNSSKVWIHRPRETLIDMRHCIDMDCDAMKKNLLTDKDGSLLGSPGAVFSQSEFEWGSQKRGLGDFRIPKELLSSPNETMRPISEVYKQLGIVRDETLCSYRPDWQAYECHGLEYKMMIIESMDNDTEMRRLSPVAILSDNKYLDLINGPQDHSRCGGYTCSKRISTFISLVAANKSYDVYLTGTPPNQLRFRILNADASFKIRLSLYYLTPQRIDLYKMDKFIAPTNADYSSGKMRLKDPGQDLAALMPSYLNESGTNLFHPTDRKMYFSIDGAQYIDLKIAPVLFVKFGLPAITPEEFFNEQTLVGNFAKLLGIEPSKIRRVQIIRETSRKRRQANGVSYVALTIFEDAATSLNNTQAVDSIQSDLIQLDAKISNLYVTGQLQQQAQSVLNITLASLSIQQPSANSTIKPLVKIAKTLIVRQASGCKAQTPCSIQPVIMVVDDNNNLIENIGSTSHPWIIQAQINSTTNTNAQLILETEVAVVNGYANFTRLGISDVVNNLIISFSFKLPNGLNSSSFDPLNILANPVSAAKPQLTCRDYSSTVLVNELELFNLTISIVDQTSLIKIPNITWNNYAWTARIQMFSLGYYPGKGNLSTSNTTVTFDQTTGLALFTNLAITKSGMYLISITVASTNNEYSLQCYSNLIQIKQAKAVLKSYSSEVEPDYVLKFNGNYSQIDPNEIKANIYNYISDYGVNIAGITSYPGSVFVAFYSDDSSDTLINQLIAAGINISSSLTFVSISLNGNTFICSNCSNSVIIISNANTTITTTVAAASAVVKNEVLTIAVSIGAIVGGVIGGVVLITALVFGFFGYKKFAKIKFKHSTIHPKDVSNGLPSYKETTSNHKIQNENI